MGLEVQRPEPSSAPTGVRSRAAKVAAVLGVLGLLALAHRSGILQQFAEPAKVARSLRELGILGGAVFVLAYALLQPFGVPGTVFILAAPLIWPWPIAFALSMVGTMAASVVGFSFARFVARDWVAGRVPARFRKYDAALADRAFSTVFTLRFVFWMPQLLHAFLGVSRVPFWTHFWASLAGYAIPLFLVSFFGQKLFDLLKRAPPSVWLALAASAVAFIVVAWLRGNRASAS